MSEVLHTRCQTITQTPNAFFHLVNPSKTTWSSLIPAVQAKYNVQSVPLTAWCDELASIKNPSEQDMREKPALKLLDFYQGLSGEAAMSAPIDVQRTREASG